MAKPTATVKNRYNKKAYDHIHYAPPVGYREEIKAAADAKGMSVNAYITLSVEKQIERDRGE